MVEKMKNRVHNGGMETKRRRGGYGVVLVHHETQQEGEDT